MRGFQHGPMLLLILAAALPVPAAAGDPQFGVVTGGNIAAQAGPIPTYAGVPMEGSDGRRASRAANRYRRGMVTPLTLPRAATVGAAPTPETSGQAGTGDSQSGSLPQS